MTIKTYSNSKNGNMKIEDDFVLSEHASSYSDTVKLDDRLYPHIQAAKDHFGAQYGYITSGYRTDQHSEDVGGYAGDQHTKGTAADFKLKLPNGSYVSAEKICCFLQDRGLPGIGKINEQAVHVDVRTSGKWWGDETTGKTVTDFYSYFGIPKSSSKPIPTPTLKKGMYDNNEVKELQAIIGATVDGDFGDKTESKLKDWQKKYMGSAEADGIYGPKTEAKMKEVY